MNEISKHFDLYQFFVYLLPGIFFILAIYFLLLFGVFDVGYFQNILHPDLLPNFENNVLLFGIIGLIIAYFVGHMLHMIGMFLFSYKKLFKRIKKKCNALLKKCGYEKTNKQETKDEEKELSDNDKIKKYVEDKFGFKEDGLQYADYMLTYLFLEDFVQSKKIKLMQTLLGMYKSLFIIGMLVTILAFLKNYWTLGIVVLVLSLGCFRQACTYHKTGTKNTYTLAYLYFKNLKK